MKTAIQKFSALLMMIACFTLLSFNMRPGAHSFQVFLDDQMVIDRYAKVDMEAPIIDISGQHKTIDVRYSECGRTVSGRKLTLKDGSNKVLKVWQYDGKSSGLTDAMSCSVKDVAAFAKEHGNSLKLFYTSNDFLEGLHVVTLKLGQEKVPG